MIAPEAGPLDITDAEPSDWNSVRGRSLEYLSHVTEGSSIISVEPRACIPLFLGREKSENAIERLKGILNGDLVESHKDVRLTGIVSGTPTSVVVPLINSLYYIVDEHLESIYDCAEDVNRHKQEFSIWYGVIDGSHFLCALVELCAKNAAKWEGYKWRVFCVPEGHPLSEYEKLAIVQNERNRETYHFETTSYDMLRRLRAIYDKLFDERSKLVQNEKQKVLIHHRDVAHKYDGGDHDRNTTVRQAVSVAVRLSAKTIKAIGYVSNMTCPDIILTNGSLNKHNIKSKASAMRHYDCRLFRKLFSISTLRGAKTFINAIKDGEEEAQVNTIYRVRHWSEDHDFRSVNPETLSTLFNHSKLALDEENKFLSVLGQTHWPANMETIRDNLLRSTTHDEDIAINEGNSTDVLPMLWKSFKRLYPGRAKGLEAEQKGENDSPEAPQDEPQPPEPAVREEVPDELTEEERKRIKEEEDRKKELARQTYLRSVADKKLEEMGIVTHDGDFMNYKSDIWSSSSNRFDLVVSALPSNISDDTIYNSLPSFCKNVLKTGSYAFLIVNESQIYRLQQAFRKSGLKVCDHSFSIVYDTSTLKRHKNCDFPQRSSEIAMIAKTRGQHPSCFQPDFATLETTNNVDQSRSSFAALTNIETCSGINKLKRPHKNISLFPEERSTALFSRVISIFSPPEGMVLDPFGGALTTSLACLQTCRSCVSMDTPNDVFRYAKSRLRIFAVRQASMADLEIYADPVKPGGPDACTSEAEHSMVGRKQTDNRPCLEDTGQVKKRRVSQTDIDASFDLTRTPATKCDFDTSHQCELDPDQNSGDVSTGCANDTLAPEVRDLPLNTHRNTEEKELPRTELSEQATEIGGVDNCGTQPDGIGVSSSTITEGDEHPPIRKSRRLSSRQKRTSQEEMDGATALLSISKK